MTFFMYDTSSASLNSCYIKSVIRFADIRILKAFHIVCNVPLLWWKEY